MDLFNQGQAEVDIGKWASFLNIKTLDNLVNTIKSVNKEREKETIYPEKEDVLRIFRDLEPKDINVVIIGQDPYHNGNANGYAFGCKETVSPSLNSILQAIFKDTKKQPVYKDKTLSYLVNQGVLLLNTNLTVIEGNPLSHNNIGWNLFVEEVIKLLAKQNRPIVWLLWGSYAKGYEKFLDIEKHYILTAEHPVSAVYRKREWKCTHFSKVNNYLKSKNLKPIIWM